MKTTKKIIPFPAIILLVAIAIIPAFADSGTVWPTFSNGQPVFSDTERKILPWVIFFILAGIVGGFAKKKK